MSANFNPRRFLINLYTHKTIDGQAVYYPVENRVECVTRVAVKVVSITDYLANRMEDTSSLYSDRMGTFEAILKMLNHMQFVVAKKLAFSVSMETIDTSENKQLAVCMVLCHVCLRYVHKRLGLNKVYTFPGGLSLGINPVDNVYPLQHECGGALATILDDIVPVIPTKADALWSVESLRCLLRSMDDKDGYDGCVTFAKLPDQSTLNPIMEGHAYTRKILEACLTNTGKGTTDMELFEGYDWDSEVAVDGVRSR
jgi:hypothetical protein